MRVDGTRQNRGEGGEWTKSEVMSWESAVIFIRWKVRKERLHIATLPPSIEIKQRHYKTVDNMVHSKGCGNGTLTDILIQIIHDYLTACVQFASCRATALLSS